MNFVLRKLRHGYIWERLLRERLSEPLHMNIIAAFVWLFGSLRSKIRFDLVTRQHSAYAILKCADLARERGLHTVSLIEFGVSTGAGLLNMAEIAARVTRATGINFRIYGFDTGKGMPPARDYRDHPELYQAGDFPMKVAALRERLPSNVELVLGEVADTLPGFLDRISDSEPIGYVVFDLDYYYSTVDALKVLLGPSTKYLPLSIVYLDDIYSEYHNSYCGELLAVREFNEHNKLRKIEAHPLFSAWRLFKNAVWQRHVMFLHVLDHPLRATVEVNRPAVSHINPYLPGS